ncbi:MAG: DUF3857 and transglutaminase domain-containing protein [Williamsia sp.]|nr:DUF3857 and transglutaminase domain-containing protein [Williamsia sp.]
MTWKFAVAVCAVCCIFCSGSAQDKLPIKFGKVSAEDFDLSKNKFDSSADAVVIADVGNSSFVGNNKGWFSLVFKKQTRIKILNKNGFDVATEDIVLYSKGGEEEKLDNLKATTYNLEGGKVVETKLDASSIFKEKISANLVRRKFTLPAVKEGSIIEYTYTITSDFLFNLQPWQFQGGYPRLWSEYEVQLPDFFNYVFLSQGYHPYSINTQSNEFKTFAVTEPNSTGQDRRISVSGNVLDKRWVMKDVPALKQENFTSTLSNHVAKIEFQLSQYRFPNQPVQDIMGNWFKVSERLMNDETFGAALAKNNNWLDDELKTIDATAKTDLEKAKKIYEYVRDHFTCTDHADKYLNNPLRTVFKNKNGSVADINLLLIAMLRHENIYVNPVLLSTRNHGFAHELYPLMDRFNYVIAEMVLNDKPYYLDASWPELGFGKLSPECYNGVARVINSEPKAVYFIADSLEERKVTSVFTINNEKGEMEGNFQSMLGYTESMAMRKSIRAGEKDDVVKKIKSAYGSDYHIQSIEMDSLKSMEDPITLHYGFVMDKPSEDIIYFNPLLAEGYKENILKAAERFYPVEMPFTMNETYILNMEIPAGYTIDEMPKSTKVSFNENEGMFEYIIAKTDTHIQLRSRVVLKKATFMPDEYNPLRDFFAYIVKKHSEQIVFKKKK